MTWQPDKGDELVHPELRSDSCPECAQGKHDNCTGWALNARDEEVDCACYLLHRHHPKNGYQEGGTPA